MTPEELTLVIAQCYLGMFTVGFCLLMMAEAVIPLDPPGSERERSRHILRHFAFWILTLVVGDLIVGDWILGIPDRLYEAPRGLLHDVAMPFPVLVIVGILAADFGEYVFHRLAHANRWLWLIHAVHHADDRLDVSSALRFHPAETALNLSWKLGLFWVLGLPLWLVAARSLLMLPASLLQHANIQVPEGLDRSLRWLVITPALHKLHHSPRPDENNTNYGEVFSCWDILFGTLNSSGQPKAVKYGLPNLTGDRWQTVRGMLTMPVTARHLPSL